MAEPVKKVKTYTKLKKNHKLSRGYRDHLSGKYVRQRGQTELNRSRRLRKHIKLHPDDLQALAALK